MDLIYLKFNRFKSFETNIISVASLTCDTATMCIRYKTDWKVIHDRKQKQIDYNNRRENAKRIDHTYNVNGQVLVHDKAPGDIDNKYGKTEWEGPYTVMRYTKDTGTVYVRQGALIHPYNIRKIKPYVT